MADDEPVRCPRCGGAEWRDALPPPRRTIWITAAELSFVLTGILAAVVSPWFFIALAFALVFVLAVVLRSRQLLCASCGWARAVRTTPKTPE